MNIISQVFSKKDFIEYIEKQIDDDQIVIISNMIDTIKVNKRKKTKSVEIHYPTTGFKVEGGVTDLLKSINVGLVIAKKDIITEELQKGL